MPSIIFRNNNIIPQDIDDPTLLALSNLAGTPLPKSSTPRDKRKALDAAIDWLRKNNPTAENVSNPTVTALVNFPGTAAARARALPGVDEARCGPGACRYLRARRGGRSRGSARPPGKSRRRARCALPGGDQFAG